MIDLDSIEDKPKVDKNTSAANAYKQLNFPAKSTSNQVEVQSIKLAVATKTN